MDKNGKEDQMNTAQRARPLPADVVKLVSKISCMDEKGLSKRTKLESLGNPRLIRATVASAFQCVVRCLDHETLGDLIEDVCGDRE